MDSIISNFCLKGKGYAFKNHPSLQKLLIYLQIPQKNILRAAATLKNMRNIPAF